MKDTMIGVDLAKPVFQVHGASMAGEMKFRKKLTREQFRRFMSDQPACLVVFEACGSASYWAREMETLGHDVKLIAPQYVWPFVKRQKNGAADAEAIVIAARQPEMRFVAPKTAEQQAKAVMFRSRERLVHQRTELGNALRAADGRLTRCPLKGTTGDALFAVLCACGHKIRKMLAHLRALLTLLIGAILSAFKADRTQAIGGAAA